MTTKKDKVELFDALRHDHDLYQRYFWDSRGIGFKSDAKTRVRTKSGDILVFTVYHVEAAHGGYIVLESMLKYETHGQPATRQFGTPSIRYWDEWQAETNALTDYMSEYVQAARQALEELRVSLVRNHAQVCYKEVRVRQVS
jgi:hypothetical protein